MELTNGNLISATIMCAQYRPSLNLTSNMSIGNMVDNKLTTKANENGEAKQHTKYKRENCLKLEANNER